MEKEEIEEEEKVKEDEFLLSNFDPRDYMDDEELELNLDMFKSQVFKVQFPTF